MNKRTQTKLVTALAKIDNGLGDSPTVYIDRDEPGQVVLSAEAGDGFADYYAFTIDERIEEAASKLGLFWEWENAGAVIAYPI
jgi:hypothetical protein